MLSVDAHFLNLILSEAAVSGARFTAENCLEVPAVPGVQLEFAHEPVFFKAQRPHGRYWACRDGDVGVCG